MDLHRIVTICFLLLISNSIFSQKLNEKITFQRYGTDCRVRLKAGKEVTLILKPEFTLQDTIQTSMLGSLSGLQNNNLQILTTTEYKKVISSNEKVSEFYKKYSYDTVYTINAENIDYVMYECKARPLIELSTFASVISLLVIAPLYAYNVKEGTFNSDVYLMLAKPAALATIITVPLYFNIQDRKVTLIKK